MVEPLHTNTRPDNSSQNTIAPIYKRKHFTKQRRALTFAQRRKLSQQAGRYLNHHHLLSHAKHIAIYADDFGELPTQPIFDWAIKHNKQMYLPVVQGDSLVFRKVSVKNMQSMRLAQHPLGMLEPKSGKTVKAEKLDIIFMPLVAADRNGNRMGMGGGFYDRTLAQCIGSSTNPRMTRKPIRVGWAYDFQLVQQLASNPWDIPLHALITPSCKLVF